MMREVLESFATKRRDREAELKFLSKGLKRHGGIETPVTNRLASTGAARTAPGRRDF